MIKCIFFDLGNTLINEDDAQKITIRKLVEKLNQNNININTTEFEDLMIKASMNYAERLVKMDIGEIKGRCFTFQNDIGNLGDIILKIYGIIK